MKKRKGYFFLIDSILALGILVVATILIFSSFADVPERDDPAFLSEGILDFLANTEVSEFNDPFAGIGGVLWANGTITRGENTLLQQVAIFYQDNNLDTAEDVINNTAALLLPEQFLFEFYMDSVLIYPSNPSQVHINSKATTPVLIPARKIVYGLRDPELGIMFGPYQAEVIVWQRTE